MLHKQAIIFFRGVQNLPTYKLQMILQKLVIMLFGDVLHLKTFQHQME